MEKYTSLHLALIRTSPTNPRKHFSESNIQELATSMNQHGLLEPLGVRLLPTGVYEIVFGERRFRAATALGWTNISCKILELNDDQVFDMQVAENLNREDLTPLDEGEAYDSILKKRRGVQLIDIANKFGKTEEYVYSRIRLVNLIPEAKQYLEKDILPVTAAIKISQLEQKLQKEALNMTIVNVIVNGVEQPMFSGLKDLKAFFDHNVLMPLAWADFDVSSEKLAACGSCMSCMKRTMPGLFKDMTDSDKCLDLSCYRDKHIAHYQDLHRQYSEKMRTVVYAARYPGAEKHYKDLGDIISIDNYQPVDAKKEKSLKDLVYAVFVGPSKSHEKAIESGYIRIINSSKTEEKKPEPIDSTPQPEVSREQAEQMDLKAAAEANYDNLLWEAFRDNECRRDTGLHNMAQIIAIAKIWSEIQLENKVVYDLCKKYDLTLNVQALLDGEHWTPMDIKPGVEISEDVFFTLDFDEIVDNLNNNTSTSPAKDKKRIEFLLLDIVFLASMGNGQDKSKALLIGQTSIDDKAVMKAASAKARADMRAKKTSAETQSN